MSVRTLPSTSSYRAIAAAAVLATGASSLAIPAEAQTTAVQDGEFSVQRFEPAPGPRNYLSVAGGRTDGELTWGAGVMFDYQRAPFVLQSCVSATDCSSPANNVPDTVVVRDMLTWNVLGSFTPIPRVQIGLRVPVAYVAGDGIDLTDGGPNVAGLSAFGLGDIALQGKVRIYGEPQDLFVLAAALTVAAPLGHATAEGSYLGNETPITAGGRVIADISYEGFTAAVNVGGIYRDEAQLGDTPVGSELRYGAAAGYRFHELIGVFAETFGATRFSSQNGTNPLEIDGGVRLMLLDERLQIRAAGGTGLIRGVGVPTARAIIGISFFYDKAADQDDDKIPDDVDECPTKAEDFDQIADEDGCPEADHDRDKILDEDDRCPLQPETENNFEDSDGCPDVRKDSDNDGVLDQDDKCPTQAGKMKRPEFLGCPDTDQDGVADKIDLCKDKPEDTDGFKDTDGCPDPDNDGDGVPDIADQCADGFEVKNGIDDDDGCPDFLQEDDDDDGVPDDSDACKSVPENLNGEKDEDGCPEPKATLVEVKPEAIKLLKDLVFKDKEATITDPQSLDILKALATGLRQWPQIVQIEIAVTAPGKDQAALGKARADEIVKQLTAQGVPAKRLIAAGNGGDKAAVTITILQVTPRTPPSK